jgi:L-rhamnose-H+ transport protein
MVPLVAQHGAVLGSRKGAMVILAVSLMTGGIAICGWAGRLRELSKQKSSVPLDRSYYRRSLLIAVTCGLLSSMFNHSFAFGQEIASAAIRHGNSAPRAAYAVWPIALAGGFVPNFVYCVYLLYRKGSWRAFLSPNPDLLLSGAMTGLWAGSFALYGMSAAYLGRLGASAGWGVTQIFAILSANASGIIAGEWTAAPRRAHKALWGGLCLLVIALGIMAAANAA